MPVLQFRLHYFAKGSGSEQHYSEEAHFVDSIIPMAENLVGYAQQNIPDQVAARNLRVEALAALLTHLEPCSTERAPTFF